MHAIADKTGREYKIMYKLALPISMNTITEQTLPIYLEQAKKCGADRVFIGGMGPIYSKYGRIYTMPDKIKAVIDYFHAAGLEVGIWVLSLGNGHALTPESRLQEELKFTQITGINGESRSNLSNCPLDKNFVKACQDGMRRLAELGPDLIMIDDDFRLNIRINVRFACFCPLHLKEYYKRIGEEIPREKLEELILTGGPNKYRTELLKLFKDTMIDFAKALRHAVDEINPQIRLGQCTHDTWDMMGTDPLEISIALAGNTAPFARISGAPFRNIDIIPIVEFSRQQYAWGKDSGVELFSEGDVYPRPRPEFPSRPLELFELLMLADGTSNGMLAYLFDYHCKPNYETGYVDRFCKNEELRQGIKELFEGKKPVGVEVFGVAHKAEYWQLPDELEPKTFEMLVEAVRAPSRELLSANSIPTSFSNQTDYPILIMGENARHIDLNRLSQGAILDVPAAKILQERGVDTGLLSGVIAEADKEYYKKYDDAVLVSSHMRKRGIFYRIECHENAEVWSTFTPDNTPASYCYENENGQRFFVLAFDHFRSQVKGIVKNFSNSYYRQADLVDAIQWICKKKLPAFSAKNPNLYFLAAKKEEVLSVAIANVSIDVILSPEIELDKRYSKISFLNCTGRLEGDKIYLSDISPYGFCAFEVK